MKIRFLYKRPLLNVIFVLAVTAFFAYYLPKANIDNDISKMLPESTPSMLAYEENTKVFGGSNVIIIGLESKTGSILTSENMRIIDAITKEAKEIKTPQKVSDAVSADDNRGDDLLADFADLSSGDDLLADFERDLSSSGLPAENSDLYDPLSGFDLSSENVTDGISGAELIPPQNITFTQRNNAVEIRWDSLAGTAASEVVAEYRSAKKINIEKTSASRTLLQLGSMTLDETYFFEIYTVDSEGKKSRKVRRRFTTVLPDNYPLVNQVMSITSTDFLTGSEEGIIISPIIDVENNGFPESDEEFDEIRAMLSSWELYDLNILSRDEKSAAIYVRLTENTKVPHHEMVYNELEKIIEKHITDDLNVRISGLPAMTLLVGRLMLSDLAFLIPFVIIVVMLTLLMSLKRFGGVILPLIGVLLSTVWAVGLMAALGKRMDLVGSSIPIILIAVGSAYGIHIITHYYEEIKKRNIVSDKEHKEIVIEVVEKIGAPVFFASITTLVGFLSFLTSPMDSLRNFGLFVAIGILSAVMIALFFVPSLLIVKHGALKKMKKEKVHKRDTVTYIMMGMYHVLGKRKRTMLIISASMVLISVFFITKIRIDSQIVEYFKPDATVAQDDKYLNEHFAGTHLLDVTVKGTKPGDLAEPEILLAMDNLALHLKETFPQVRKVMGYHDFIKKLNEVMHYDHEDPLSFYEIPSNPEKYGMSDKRELKDLISQYLLLYSGDIGEYSGIDTLSPNMARMNLIMNTSDPYFFKDLNEEIRKFTADNFPDGYQVTTSGGADMTNTLNDLVVNSQMTSLLLSFLLVFMILALSYRSFWAGLIGIVPLSFSVILNFGLMGLLGISLNIATALIASIAVGIGVDYTIHFLSAYRDERRKSGDLERVTKAALLTSGKAILFNALAVGLGFAVLIFSSFTPLVNLGILLAVVMFTSSMGALVLLPVILNTFDPKFLRK